MVWFALDVGEHVAPVIVVLDEVALCEALAECAVAIAAGG